MFLNYFALGVLIFVFLVIFYGIIMIHDIPYLIAKKRNHPHADAIHTAGWVSLFTLHVIWPFLWIWATLYQPERGWGMQAHVSPQEKEPEPGSEPEPDPELIALSKRVEALERKLAEVQSPDIPPSES
ncbi:MULTISPECIES: DUF3302 domain-containing protein [Citrobacter]|uniref:DUF3302 domain-containing protein n=1 Tax=Citrobacter TaxID=544 RepID=UPI0019060285|nr:MULTISPECIES: DUF3302 domain-containing protein [Citrobacter]MBJ9123263.1 DUF3302 domain-containing protein [Citrobacter koseri]MDM2971832.1 DUF3302 domain-containing protein [Citrobacter sp. CK198]MDM3066579.1 DUF3302 domain-containing protein [Citrobacter sp. CK180]MDT7492953.1 DUF3302 domain-containing protein [Citrobacter koseri]CAG0212641.1 Inner membrane protein YiaW [Citrobacter koseri]